MATNLAEKHYLTVGRFEEYSKTGTGTYLSINFDQIQLKNLQAKWTNRFQHYSSII